MYRPLELKLINFISHKDTAYKFSENPVLLVGVNEDDSSQKGNGSGKSALIEAIPLAIVGESMRKAKPKELIRRGCDSAEVHLTLYNKQLGKILSIKRTVFLKKASKVEVVFGNHQVQLASVTDYDSFILKTLEISKEDFFDFFVIKKDNFVPFFNATDGKKKSIINRFSKANILDDIKPLIDKDVDALLLKQLDIQKKKAYNEGQIQLLKDQISQKSPARHIALIEVDIDLIKIQQLKCQENIAFARSSIESLDLSNNKKRKLIEECIQTTTVKQKEIEEAREVYKAKSEVYKVLHAQHTSQMSQGATVTDEHYKDRALLTEEFNKVKQQLSSLEAKTRSSIECPKCAHKFTLADAAFDVAAALIYIKEHLHVELEALRKEVVDINFTIAATIEKNKKELEDLVLQTKEAEVEVSIAGKVGGELKQELQRLEDIKDNLNREFIINERDQKDAVVRIEKLQTGVKEYSLQMQTLIAKIKEIEESKDILEDPDTLQVTTLEAENETLLEKEQDLIKNIQDKKAWIGHFKNFKSFLANQSIGNIQDYTNMYLSKMGSDLSVLVDGYRNLADGSLKEEISIEVYRGQFAAGSYGTFSAGERARMDIACILSIQHLINLSCEKGGGLNLIVVDEILDAADAIGIQSIIESISDSSATIMIVSQNEINSNVAKTVTVTKKHGVSTIN